MADTVTSVFGGHRERRVKRVGLVATNSIRGGANRAVLDEIARLGRIFAAWSNEEWTIEGAAVRVSLVCFDGDASTGAELDGMPLSRVGPDLSARVTDLTTAQPLAETAMLGSNGISKKGAFDVDGETARRWLAMPLNPNGRPNSDVLFPWLNGEDVTARRSDKWIVNFGERSETDASLYETPFQHVLKKVKPQRTMSGSPSERRLWWLLARRAPNLFASLIPFRRFIAAPETPTHTVFAWLPKGVVPDKNLVIFARDDDTSFGVLSSRFHVSWARALGSPYGNHPTAKRYNSTRVFRTFPFPDGLTLNRPAAEYAGDPARRCDRRGGAPAQ
jgi:hypothetical protein